jgi:hypothetical protein
MRNESESAARDGPVVLTPAVMAAGVLALERWLDDNRDVICANGGYGQAEDLLASLCAIFMKEL